jgi:hypothetical protein
MLLLARNFQGESVETADGVAGKVRELLFDDHSWQIRHIVVETGRWWQSHEVLVEPEMVERHELKNRRLLVGGSVRQVKALPSADTDLPVARRKMIEASNLIAWDGYWTGMFRQDLAMPGDPHLRSTKILPGLHIVGTDGKLGHLADFLVDDQAWSIRYVEITTRNWRPGKRVLIEPMAIESIDWETREVRVTMPRAEIIRSPLYDPSAPIEAEREVAAHR